VSYTISWPVTAELGQAVFVRASAATLPEAESRARSESRLRGHATVTDRTGLVATFVDGERWTAPEAGYRPDAREVVDGLPDGTLEIRGAVEVTTSDEESAR
jgi:hypothetical protein